MTTQNLINKPIKISNSSEDEVLLNSEKARISFDLMWDYLCKNDFEIYHDGETFLSYKDGGAYWAWFDQKGKFHYESDSWRRKKLDGRSAYTEKELEAGLKEKRSSPGRI